MWHSGKRHGALFEGWWRRLWHVMSANNMLPCRRGLVTLVDTSVLLLLPPLLLLAVTETWRSSDQTHVWQWLLFSPQA